MQCTSPSCDQNATFHPTWIEDRQCVKEEHFCENHALLALVSYGTEPKKPSGTPRILQGATEFDLDLVVTTEIKENQLIWLCGVVGSRRIPIMIGKFEAAALVNSIKHETSSRPQTHDAIVNTFQALGCEMEYLLVHKLENHTYFGDLHIRQQDRLATVDVRPSDGFVLAVLLDRPIFFANEVVEKSLSPPSFTILSRNAATGQVVVKCTRSGNSPC